MVADLNLLGSVGTCIASAILSVCFYMLPLYVAPLVLTIVNVVFADELKIKRYKMIREVRKTSFMSHDLVHELLNCKIAWLACSFNKLV